jgi:hypothetical protein
MCIRRETREKARQSLAFSRVSKTHTHITHMLQQCTSIVYLFSIGSFIVSWNPTHGELYLIQHYVIKFLSDLRQVSGFIRIPPPIKLTATK